MRREYGARNGVEVVPEHSAGSMKRNGADLFYRIILN
jgi:hypothetical protein